MRFFSPAVVAVASTVAVSPLAAQDTVTLGVFVTVRSEHAPDFEEAAREHAQWHADQGDPQAWPAYQALTGRGEYVFVAPDRAWSDFDSPAVDMAEDVAAWAESAAPYIETEEFTLWTQITGGNPPADPTAFPVVQVFEFEVRPGGQPALMEAIEKFSEALAAVPFHWEWATVVSADGPPSVFVALWAPDFASIGTPGPGPAELLSDAFGPERGAMVLESFAEAARLTSSQIWMLRPDLSYFPM